jgi:hypothetical protein
MMNAHFSAGFKNRTMKNCYLFTAFLLVAATTGMAQTKITGTVTENNGNPIPGANIFLQDTYDGSTSDANGKFQFTSTENGPKILVAKFIGYKEYRKEILLEGKTITLEVQLPEEINELKAVTITAGSFGASDESRRTIFRPLDIATTAGATADIAASLNTLPGTQKVGESGRLFVRGGDGNEARTFIDGMLVQNAYNASAPNTPSRGRFLPFMFKGTSFSTGGYSAEYGQALSSALALDSKDKSELTRTDIGLLSVGGDVSHTQVCEKASWAGKIQYTNIKPYYGLINQRIDWNVPFSSLEGTGVFRHQLGKNGLVKVFGNLNSASFSLYNHDIDDPSLRQLFDLKNDFRYLNTAFKNALGDKWSVRGGMSYNFMRNNVIMGNDNFIDVEKAIHGKTVFEGSLSERLEVKAGVEVIDRDYSLKLGGDPRSGIGGFHETITALFVEGDFYTSNRFVMRAGSRLEYNNLLNAISIDPRLSLAYKTGDIGSISAAYGTFRQSPKNDLLRVDNSLKPEKADHYILSYQVVNDDRTFRTELYYKDYHDLIKFGDGAGTQLNNSGCGYAQGIEFFWRDKRSFKNTDYWVSYSYLDTKRDYLNFPYEAIPSFASAHNFSAVYKYFFTKLKTQFGATYSFASGRPYNNPNIEKFNAGRTPDYHDLSINIAYLPKPNVIIYFSGTNILGRDNVFGYEFSDKLNEAGTYNSRAIQQPARRWLFVGVFITLSKEKSVNQLPSL